MNVFTLCLMPAWNDPAQATGLNHSCLKVERNDSPFFTPNTADSRAYNLYLRNPKGSLVLEASGREISAASYRISAQSPTECREATSARQIGCLASHYACSIGIAGSGAAAAGAAGLFVQGIEPSATTILSHNYPLARSYYLATLKGFENVSNMSSSPPPASSVVTNEYNIAACFADRNVVNAAAVFAGLVPVNAADPTAAPRCIDFPEDGCLGNPPNRNACASNPLPREALCGNGLKDGLEACDDGNRVSGDGCENNCTITVDIDISCVTHYCQGFRDACNAAVGNAAAGPAAGQSKSALCKALIDCSEATQCAKGSLAAGETCYCGTAGTTDCISGSANGACKAQSEAAAESTNGLTVGQRWLNPSYAVGFAGQFIQCAKQNCSSPLP